MSINIMKNPPSLKLWRAKVELAGVEPASKHGSHTLSTCLVLLDFRERTAAEQPNRTLFPVVSPSDRNNPQTSPGLRAPPCRVGSGLDRPGSVSSRYLVPG